MKKLYLILFLFGFIFSFGQMRTISKKIQSLNEKHQSFESFHLFSKNNDVQKSTKYVSAATDATVLNINSQELKRLVQEGPDYLEISVPYKNEVIILQLYKQSIFTDSFRATDEEGNEIAYTPGQYYRGIVKGDETSLAGISFFNSDIIGVISITNLGNIVVGKSVDKQDFVSYSDKNLTGENPFRCGLDEVEYNQNMEQTIHYDPSMVSKTMTENCVRIYYEVAYRPYQINGSDEVETLNWLSGIHNNISTLYANDDIQISLHAVKIWTTSDPYTGNFSQNLYDFRENTPEFDGDLAHLVTSRPGDKTSVAFLNSLCSTYNYAFSNVEMNYPEVPTYSWTIMASTHETGHALGSPHTHACAWNGDDTAIDGCAPTYDPSLAEGNCDIGPIPDKGTIMSYCHLLNSVGVDFNLGFGEQPGELIRTTVDSKPCLGTDCMEMSVQDLTESNGVTVYPNPTFGILNIQSKEKINSLKLNDISGKTVMTFKSTKSEESIDLNKLPSGVYILSIETKTGNTIKKIIKN